MAIRRFVVPVTVDDQGDGTGYSPYLSGKLISIRYVKDDFANGVDFTITADVSGRSLWAEENVNASATRHPRVTTQDSAGADALYAAMGVEVLDLISLSQDRVKIVVASGGDTTSGTFHITIDG